MTTTDQTPDATATERARLADEDEYPPECSQCGIIWSENRICDLCQTVKCEQCGCDCDHEESWL